jgi:hypothetical protein
MDFNGMIKPAIKGGLVGAVALTVGGMITGISFLTVLAPYVAIVGGAVTLVIVDMFYK